MSMDRRRPNLSEADRRRATGMDDLFDRINRQQPSADRDDEVWNVQTITAKTGLARATLYRYIQDGRFPRQRRLGPRRVGWLASEVRVWIATRPKT